MRIAVITPYYNESTEVLRQCHQSVITQNIAADHFFVADGFPNKDLADWNIKHVSLPQAHADNGNTPRGIGSILADIEGYDFISYLDADNWFHPNHLASLLKLYDETKADICSTLRTIHTNDGIELSVQDSEDLSLEHIDTSCYFLHRNAFGAIDIWLKMPKILSPICDRIFYSGLKHKNYKFASTQQKTVAFRSQYKAHYLAANIDPPPGLKDDVLKLPYEWLLTVAGMKEATTRLGFIPL